MTGRNSLHYCYDVSYQCWFASEEAKIYCNNCNSSNAVVSSHLILAYTVRLAIINAVDLERNGCFLFFVLPLLRNVVLWLKRTPTKSLQIELVTKYDTKDALKESLVRGSKSAKGGPYPLADLDREGGSKSAGCPNLLWHRDDVSSHLKYYQLFREILEYKLILFRSGHFDHDMEKI